MKFALRHLLSSPRIDREYFGHSCFHHCHAECLLSMPYLLPWYEKVANAASPAKYLLALIFDSSRICFDNLSVTIFALLIFQPMTNRIFITYFHHVAVCAFHDKYSVRIIRSCSCRNLLTIREYATSIRLSRWSWRNNSLHQIFHLSTTPLFRSMALPAEFSLCFLCYRNLFKEAHALSSILSIIYRNNSYHLSIFVSWEFRGLKFVESSLVLCHFSMERRWHKVLSSWRRGAEQSASMHTVAAV